MTKLEIDTIRVQTAMALREQAEFDFAALCQEGRMSPVTVDQFAKNQNDYNNACQQVYRAMWLAMADTGVQILDTTVRPAVRAEVGTRAK